MTSQSSEATQLLARLSAGDGAAGEELLPFVYEELRRVAGSCMRTERDAHTLQPTALVHEAYMRLIGVNATPQWQDRQHFVRLAARAMRHILVDHARKRGAVKRGGAVDPIPLDSVVASFEEQSLDVLALHDCLEQLNEMDEGLAKLVELRFFAGLTIDETAKVMELSPATVERRWKVARMWLKDRLED
ncbi:MAG: sigma-70 family RNA polymerase sigma factor [bacterium]|nr:sigma-70 family RNA polymerase sigma factor [bacterium]